MHNVALSWSQAAWLASALAVVALGLRRWAPPAPRRLTPLMLECALIAALYALWQLAGHLSVTDAHGAFARAEWIERVERAWQLWPERRVQDLIIQHPLPAQAANIYYATMHFGVIFAFLLWLFLRHRDQYRAVRRTLALTTLACLLIQLVPVAPPRLLPGYVDTAHQYGQSVYALGFGADELSAMPSVHVAWAVLVGWYAVRIGRGRWRWAGAAHAGATVFVVVATANHFWADGIVAVLVLAGCAWLQVAASRAAAALRARLVQLREAGPAAPVPSALGAAEPAAARPG